MLRVLVMVSGGGTNLQAILDRVADGTLKNVQIVRVLSNNPGVKALDRAAAAGVEGKVVCPKDYADRADFNRDWLAACDEVAPDLIVLAGCLVIQPAELIRRYAGKIINIHPALIPAFCGKGFYGLKPHEAALARGVKLTGATVHFVDEGTDTGPIILQKAVAVKNGDTPQILQRRVMEEAEWELLPQAIGLIAAGRVHIENGHVIIEEEDAE